MKILLGSYCKTLSDKLVAILITLATVEREEFSISMAVASTVGEDSTMTKGSSLLTLAKTLFNIKFYPTGYL